LSSSVRSPRLCPGWRRSAPPTTLCCVKLVFFLLVLAGVSEAQCAGKTGRVVDHLTGDPIVGAEVTGGFNSSAVTDAEGCFVVDVFFVVGEFNEVCGPMAIDCGYLYSVYASGYVPYRESGYRPPPDRYPFYVEIRLASVSAALCTGDCGHDHAVGIDELLCGVDALLSGAESGCTCADADGDARLHVAELLAAVNNALLGCVECPRAPTFCGPLFPLRP